MKKIFLCLFLAVGICFANLVDDGFNAYDNGEYQKAAQLYQKACDGGDMLGCSNLGMLYFTGKGVKQDFKKVYQYRKMSCDGNIPQGCVAVGALYQLGKGVRQNLSTAKEYYGKACDLGDQSGCNFYKYLNEDGY